MSRMPPIKNHIYFEDTRGMFWEKRGRDLSLNIALIVLVLLSILPFLVTVNLSLKSIPQFEHQRWMIKGPFQWVNYQEAWTSVKIYLFNSIFISFFSAVGVVILSALGGYAFARGNFPLKEPLFLFIISGMMIPGILYLVPKFVLFKEFHLINTRWALLVSYWTEGQIFGIFLFRSYFESLPSGLYEAAEVDGASIWQAFCQIAFPLSKPIIGTLMVLNIMFTWNDIIWPWIAISDDKLRTISIGLSIFQQSYAENKGAMFAGYTIASIPLIVLFVFASRHFIKGLTSGAFKA